MVGNWKINISTTGMPQKVATAFAKMNETLVGAEYENIAYIGSQIAKHRQRKPDGQKPASQTQGRQARGAQTRKSLHSPLHLWLHR